MSTEQIEARAHEIANLNAYLGSSYLSALEAMYEVASEKKEYEKCSQINDLIYECVHENDDSYELCHG